jgi:hypothetical protein
MVDPLPLRSLTNIRLARKKRVRDKHSSLFRSFVIDEEKKKKSFQGSTPISIFNRVHLPLTSVVLRVCLVEPPGKVRIDIRDPVLRLRRRVTLGATEGLRPERRVAEGPGRQESVGRNSTLGPMLYNFLWL